jgi:hypothetical protein
MFVRLLTTRAIYFWTTYTQPNLLEISALHSDNHLLSSFNSILFSLVE